MKNLDQKIEDLIQRGKRKKRLKKLLQIKERRLRIEIERIFFS